MNRVTIFLILMVWGSISSVGADSPGIDGMELTLLAFDPAQGAAVLLEQAGGLETIRVGDRLEGPTWYAELIHVGEREARFDTTVTEADGRVRRVDWFVSARRDGESSSRTRIVDPNPEPALEVAAGPKSLPIQDGSNPDRRTFKLSKDGKWSEHDPASQGDAEPSDDSVKDPPGDLKGGNS